MLRILPLLLVAMMLSACGGPTYVNIPPQKGDLARHDPNSDVVREVIAEAVRGLMLEQPVTTPVAIVLPEGSSVLSHADVARRVGEGAVSPYDPEVEPAATVEAREIRIRGKTAAVDVIAPGRGGISHLTTVHLEWAPFGGWKAERIRTWRGGVQQILPSHGVQAAPVAIPE